MSHGPRSKVSNGRRGPGGCITLVTSSDKQSLISYAQAPVLVLPKPRSYLAFTCRLKLSFVPALRDVGKLERLVMRPNRLNVVHQHLDRSYLDETERPTRMTTNK